MLSASLPRQCALCVHLNRIKVKGSATKMSSCVKKQEKPPKVKPHKEAMNNELAKRDKKRMKRTMRVRKHLRGSAGKPRMCVHKSNKHIAVQLIDDDNGITLV